MRTSTEVALHHLGNLRAKVNERLALVQASTFRRIALMQVIADIDAEITAVVADDAKRSETSQQILDAIRMDTPDMYPTTETPVI